MITKEKGRNIAKDVSKKTGKSVSFIEFDGVLLHFQIEQRKLIKVIGIDGEVKQESKVVNDLFVPNSVPVYSVMTCIPEQTVNGDLEFMVEKGLSYDPKNDLRNS